MSRVSCGQQHTAIVSDAGEVFTFGLGVFGQLGHGELSDEMIPRRVEELVSNGHEIKQVDPRTTFLRF